MVRAQGLGRRFGSRWVLRHLDLQVPEGNVVGLFGPNGSGKTTLLRILATLLRPTAGKVEMLGRDLVAEAESLRAEIGLYGHETRLYGDLTAAENLTFSARVRGLAVTDGALTGALARVGLTSQAGSRVRTFSSGMRRRLGLARILVQRPRLLLLDEPFAGLDQEGLGILTDVLGARVATGGSAILATHDLARGVPGCDRFAILVGGRFAKEGPCEGMGADQVRALYEEALDGSKA